MVTSYGSIYRCAQTVRNAITPPEAYAAPLLDIRRLTQMQDYCRSTPFVGSRHITVVNDAIQSIDNGLSTFLVVAGVVGSGKTTIAARLQCRLIEKALTSDEFNYAYSYSFLATASSLEALFVQPLVYIPCTLLFNLYAFKRLGTNGVRHLEVFVDTFTDILNTNIMSVTDENLRKHLESFLTELNHTLRESIDSLIDRGRVQCRPPRLTGTSHDTYNLLAKLFETILLAYVDVLDELPIRLQKIGNEGREVARRLRRTAIILVFDQVEGLQRHIADEEMLKNVLADLFYALKNAMQNALQRYVPLVTLLLLESRAVNIIRGALAKMVPSFGDRGLAPLLNTVMPNSNFHFLEMSAEDARQLIEKLLSLCNMRCTDVFTERALHELMTLTGLTPRAISQMLSEMLHDISQRRIPLPIDSDVIEQLVFGVRYPQLATYLSYRYSLSDIVQKASEVIGIMFRSGREERETTLHPRDVRRSFIEGLLRVLRALGLKAELLRDKIDRTNYSYAVYRIEINGSRISYGLRFLYQRVDRRLVRTVAEKLQGIQADRYYLVFLHRSQQIPEFARLTPETPNIEYHYIDCDKRIPRIAIYMITKANEEFDDLFTLQQDEAKEARNDFTRLLEDIRLLPKGMFS